MTRPNHPTVAEIRAAQARAHVERSRVLHTGLHALGAWVTGRRDRARAGVAAHARPTRL